MKNEDGHHKIAWSDQLLLQVQQLHKSNDGQDDLLTQAIERQAWPKVFLPQLSKGRKPTIEVDDYTIC